MGRGLGNPDEVVVWNPTTDPLPSPLRSACGPLPLKQGYWKPKKRLVEQNENFEPMRSLFSLISIKNLRVSARLISWRPHLKVWRHLMPAMLSWVRLVTGGLTRSKVLQAAYFAQWVANMVRKQGRRGLVLHLKTAQVMLMQSLPGSELHPTSRAIGKVGVSKGGTGIPRIIPAYARMYIRRGDVSTIRFWLTMLGMYRILLIKAPLKIQTITSPGRQLSKAFLGEWCKFIRGIFLAQLRVHTGWKLLDISTDVLGRPALVAISKASADSTKIQIGDQDEYSTSYGSRFNSASRWVSGDWGWELFRYLSLHPGGTGTTQSLWTKMEETAAIAPQARASWTNKDPNRNVESLETGRGADCSGRLSVKIEPAGKARVFAIVDYWTQVALKPLHEWIFSVLREIPQDGTFDQIQPVKRLLKKVSPDQKIYSFDLSAATDRIPALVQGLLLAQIFGRQFATTWRSLLIRRPYYLGKLRSTLLGLKNPWLTYAVGQPMGAYSSWGMLALVHHAMVQFAAWRAGHNAWFALYAVLGDDVVIAEDGTAREYQALCEELGVEIGLAKSLIAQGRTLEFAKKLFFRGEDISGLPIKFWAAAQNTMGVAHALSSWYPTGSLANFVRALGIGFKGASRVDSAWEKLSPRIRALLVLLTHPLAGGRFAAPTWVDWLMSRSPVSFGFDQSKLTQFNPWADGLLTEVVLPARERIDELQKDLFFSVNLGDPARREVDSAANKAVAEAQTSIDKGEEAMKHLIRLNVKFNIVQCSAILQQVTKSAGKVELISPTGIQALKRPKEVKVVNCIDTLSIWSRLRKRVSGVLD